jgi:hypothetical protein
MFDLPIVTGTKLRTDVPTPYFEVNGRRVSGLTKKLAASFPVAKHDGCLVCSQRRSTTSRRGNGTWHKNSKKRKRVTVTIDEPLPEVTDCLGGGALEHGRIVDEQLTKVAQGDAIRVLDPCVKSIQVVCARKGWSVVATQVPIALPEWKAATAIDVVFRRGSTLIVGEIKATKVGTVNNDECYRRITGVHPCGLPISRYMQHQLQLHAAVRACHVAGLRVRGVLLRVSPTGTDVYPLKLDVTKHYF